MPPSRPDPVLLSAAARAAIVAAAAAATPAECCGALLGRHDEAGARVIDAVALPNRAPSPLNGFAIDPADSARSSALARQDRLDLIGWFHGHPRGAPQPSPRDIATAGGFPGTLHIIIAPAGLRAFITAADAWHEQPLIQETQPCRSC
ncbi:Mov34/MPN/PAD-1 family protein [Sandaracinobacteroides saxicola]|uniref:Mov34/MPN/PAD-1 family protein n=1 Tax=Sandaracinobacteroides saxicola TaxID=2759707 RepID=A0A7G5IIT1_9SPHN|nr:Mov34/MPN/PAD-1 family protein [Sandaracinobacteroides saxicola]QMW23273.1 Mov34/MPN/PAD-1 family protein [Sandaracinobacteroides saxicola]